MEVSWHPCLEPSCHSVLWRQRGNVRAVLDAFQEDLDSSVKRGFVFKLVTLQEMRKLCLWVVILEMSTLLA